MTELIMRQFLLGIVRPIPEERATINRHNKNNSRKGDKFHCVAKWGSSWHMGDCL